MEADKAGESARSRPADERAPKIVVTVDDDDARDPDEDDLDDLDDMLDEFSAVKLNSQTALPTAPAAASAAAAASAPAAAPASGAENEAADSNAPIPNLDDFSEEEFEKQLQAGMAELMSGLEGSPDIQSQFENIFKELGAAEMPSGEESASQAKSGPDLSQDASFQETIRRTMARMQASGDQATAAATAEGSEDDFIAEMMKAMKDMPEGDDNEEGFSKLLMGMMEQLTNKEILYEPMKELNDKFPGWMLKNGDSLAAEDLLRYREQQALVAEMVAKFEEPAYSDSNAQDREYIVDRMQKMQSKGSPPHDLVGDMPSAKEVLDAPEDSCATQ